MKVLKEKFRHPLDELDVFLYTNTVYVETLKRNSKKVSFFRELSVGVRQQASILNSPRSSFGECKLMVRL